MVSRSVPLQLFNASLSGFGVPRWIDVVQLDSELTAGTIRQRVVELLVRFPQVYNYRFEWLSVEVGQLLDWVVAPIEIPPRDAHGHHASDDHYPNQKYGSPSHTQLQD
jgi:hypothetical protein